MLVAFCGPMASGKDTYGEHFKSLFPNAVQYSFAVPLREEIDSIIDLIKKNFSAKTISEIMKVNEDEAETILNILKNSTNLNSKSRTPEMRKALQYWGTNVRRHSNPNYWVDLGAKYITKLLNENIPVYITDARFLNEIELINSLGGITFLLKISKENQMNRLLKRDGIKTNFEALTHPSETEHKLYNNYSFAIDTEKTQEKDIKNIIKNHLKNAARRPS